MSITGPKTFIDYVKQRRRIIWGHHQVKKVTGQSPQYLVYTFPVNPIKTVKLTSSLFRENKIVPFSIFFGLEIMINLLAILDSILGKSHVSWSVAKSTKNSPIRFKI